MSLFGFNPGFAKPIKGRKSEAMSGWGRPRAGHTHAGVDIPAPIGTPVYAMADGVAERVQPTDAGDAAGIWVGVRHPSGAMSRYMHLSRTMVAKGASVRKGQQIGLSGNTGIYNTGPHVHVDIKVPAALLPQIKAAVGAPAGGFGPMVSPYGYGVPGEPWIPVDNYAARTIAEAKANGIPLYKGAGGGVLVVAAVVGASWGLYQLLR